MNNLDMIGKKYNRWTVLRKDEERTDSRGRHDFYICQCECGNIRSINKWQLIKGKSKSCGCLSRESITKRNTKHGLSRTRLYHIYFMIRERCYRPTHISYPNYGGRGIRMCDEWLNSVESFITWCKDNGYKQGVTLDRIDANGNYEPSNCRFVTPSEQQRNRRDTRRVFFRDKEYTLADACEKFGVNKSNASVQYSRCKGDKETMTKYFESHAL